MKKQNKQEHRRIYKEGKEVQVQEKSQKTKVQEEAEKNKHDKTKTSYQ